MDHDDIERLEIRLLLDAIFHHYGYDFRNYSYASLKRRVACVQALASADKISELLPMLLYDEAFFENFLQHMSITVTEMFRDPSFFSALRTSVIPILKTYPSVKIWHAGCATGEEVYSMAILLHEEGFLDRALLYATDYNIEALKTVKHGIYDLTQFRKYTNNYMLSGGKAAFSDYYHARYGSAKLHDFLKERIVTSRHNLVCDGVFAEMNLIICRNVMIYFNKDLCARVVNLFTDSLCHRGFLCLGSKESFNPHESKNHFEEIQRKERIFRKL